MVTLTRHNSTEPNDKNMQTRGNHILKVILRLGAGALRHAGALFALNIRRSLRSRVLLALLVLCGAVLTIVPVGIRGDGTPEGYLLILVRYSLGGCTILLYLAAIWLGCLSIDVEFQHGSSELLFSKPVSRWHIWMGNWLAAVTILLLTAAITAAATYCVLRWRISVAAWSPAERNVIRERIFVAREVVRPAQANYAEMARNKLKELHAVYWPAPGQARDEALRMLEYALALSDGVVRPGESRSWIFVLDHPPSAESSTLLKYRCVGMDDEKRDGSLHWEIADTDGNVLMKQDVPLRQGIETTISIPPGKLVRLNKVVLRCTNPAGNHQPIIFSPEDLPHLEIYVGGFEANYLRSVAVIAVNLGFLAALGLCLGCVFSLPVAVFASLWVLLMISLTPYFHSMASRTFIFYSHHMVKTAPSFADHFFRAFFAILDRIFSPLHLTDPLQDVVAGHAIPLSHVLEHFVYKGIVGVLIMSSVGAYILSRRQYVKRS